MTTVDSAGRPPRGTTGRSGFPSPGLVTKLVRRAGTGLTLGRAGVLRPQRPDRLLHAGLQLLRWGSTQAAGVAVSAARHPDRAAVVDELGTLTWAELHARTNALAGALGAAGLRPGDELGILCRNHRGFLEAMLAAAKLGLTAVFLNTRSAEPQLVDVCRREAVRALVYDEEFAPLAAAAAGGLPRFVGWVDGDPTDPTLEQLIAAGDGAELAPPPTPGRLVVLTSGTTGAPRGARRQQPSSLDPVATFLERIPYRAREVSLLAAPLFHSWGLLNFSMGLALGTTHVLHRRFDPEATLAAVQRHRCSALVVVPVMLRRMLALPADTLDRYDVSSLRVIAASGSSLPGDLAIRTMDRFGDVLYNFYGSTEVAWVSIATPADLRAAPDSAGRPPRGTVVRVVDDEGRELPAGRTGRVLVGNEMLGAGYTDGTAPEPVAGLMPTGDVGHLDEAGRLFVDGRADDMIVSGGENVFPRAVEDLLTAHAKVADAAVLGVPDPDWGQRLRAVVVLEPGASATADEIRDHVRRHLAAFQVPRDVVFVAGLPRNATGKVLRRELQDPPTRG